MSVNQKARQGSDESKTEASFKPEGQVLMTEMSNSH